MAPIMGLTNRHYRNAYAEHFGGFDFSMSPFIIACGAETVSPKLFKDVMPAENTTKMTLIPQLLSKTPRGFISAARYLHGLGYATVDWNIGCPHRRVREKGRGSGMLADPAGLAVMIREVAENIPNALSLKVRLGKRKNDELFRLLDLIHDVKLAHIIVHPRTGVQMYEGKADLDAFVKVTTMTAHPLVYNGDIFTIEDYRRVRAAVPKVREFMLGRGAIADPFLPETIKRGTPVSLDERLRRFRTFHDHMYRVYETNLCGKKHLFDKLKELWSYWHLSFPCGQSAYARLCKTLSLEKYHVLVEEIMTA
jgi:tRNA-dihydrouridine synthase